MTPVEELTLLLGLMVLAWQLNPYRRSPFARKHLQQRSRPFGSPPTVRRNGR